PTSSSSARTSATRAGTKARTANGAGICRTTPSPSGCPMHQPSKSARWRWPPTTTPARPTCSPAAEGALRMPSIPRIHPAFDLHVRDADTVFALSEARRTVLRLPGLGELVSRIDGVRTLSAIVDQLDGRMPAAAVHDTIEALAARGYLSVAGPTATGLPMAAPIEVRVLATADIGPQRRQHWARQLQEAGIVVVSGDAADA